MDKTGLLKSIAETGYNVGFGAKKHFATFDIVEKGPGWIGFISISVGVFGLIYEPLSAKTPSATLTLLGVVAIYMSFYRSSEYEAVGKRMTRIFNELRELYRNVQGGMESLAAHEKLMLLEQDFYDAALSRQILFSDWYAHYKFFAQQQIGWIDEQKNFTWRDKIPLSLRMAITLVALSGIGVVITVFRLRS